MSERAEIKFLCDIDLGEPKEIDQSKVEVPETKSMVDTSEIPNKLNNE